MVSPSMRREWIEMELGYAQGKQEASPSMRREWIEMKDNPKFINITTSPSMRREWIEMFQGHELDKEHLVSLHAEGVD